MSTAVRPSDDHAVVADIDAGRPQRVRRLAICAYLHPEISELVVSEATGAFQRHRWFARRRDLERFERPPALEILAGGGERPGTLINGTRLHRSLAWGGRARCRGDEDDPEH
jgi:hypothetical protein